MRPCFHGAYSSEQIGFNPMAEMREITTTMGIAGHRYIGLQESLPWVFSNGFLQEVS